ncbi:MAG: peptide chain release factor N(5)-glutamine methyltransferase, partial [Angustibacter sp.]
PQGAVPRDPEVREHDPAVALYGGGADGLRIPRGVLRNAARLLRPGGVVFLEHAEGQQGALLAGLAEDDWDHRLGHSDLTGRPRFISARRAGRRGGPAADLPG